MIFSLFKILFLFSSLTWGAWPEAPWVNDKPSPNAVAYAVAFGSPLDFQFLKVMDVWKNLEKKYQPLGMDFIIIAKQENILPFTDGIISRLIADHAFHLPVYIDYGSNYSKKWRAYVSPTVNIVLKNEKVLSFDPGNFDPYNFEKNIQKVLKESGIQHLPPKEYNNETEYKNCTNGLTYFLGQTQRFAWGRDPIEIDDHWEQKTNWVEKNQTTNGEVTMQLNQSAVAIIAESTGAASSLIKVTVGDQKPTTVSIKSLKVYELVSPAEVGRNSKMTLQTSAKNLRLWAIQTIPQCRYYK